MAYSRSLSPISVQVTLADLLKMSENAARLNRFKNKGKDANVSVFLPSRACDPWSCGDHRVTYFFPPIRGRRSFAAGEWRSTWSSARPRKTIRCSRGGTWPPFRKRPLLRSKSDLRTVRYRRSVHQVKGLVWSLRLIVLSSERPPGSGRWRRSWRG